MALLKAESEDTFIKPPMSPGGRSPAHWVSGCPQASNILSSELPLVHPGLPVQGIDTQMNIGKSQGQWDRSTVYVFCQDSA
jgi:hypothetical protein